MLHWNTFRIVIGRAPNFWYDIADEEGLLLADEFQMWTAIDASARTWSQDEMNAEFEAWITESWNHPSIAWWDASNETLDDKSTHAIESVRHLDPTRVWENGGFNPPHTVGDPIEDHPYFFIRAYIGLEPADISVIEGHPGQPPMGVIPAMFSTVDEPGHPYINNEYAWLWITREGAPTEVTENVYSDLLGDGEHDADVYRETYAYLTGGLTEFFRARRGYAGILHFVYLGYSREGGETSDNFIDVANLELEPRWFEYAQNAFSPVGVYIDRWSQDGLEPGLEVAFPITVINDLPRSIGATLTLFTVDMSGEILTRAPAVDVPLDALGAWTDDVALEIPQPAEFTLFARVESDDVEAPTVWSRRKFGVANPGVRVPDPPFE